MFYPPFSMKERIMAQKTKRDILDLVASCFSSCGYSSYDERYVERQIMEYKKTLGLTQDEIYDIIYYHLVLRLQKMNPLQQSEELLKCQNHITFVSFSNVRQDALAYRDKQLELDAIAKNLSKRKKKKKKEDNPVIAIHEPPMQKPIGVYYFDLD